jgi:hypothetical protein
MTTQTWDDFPLRREDATVEADLPRERVVRIAGIRYMELPDNGYQLLLAWTAGPTHACRRIDTTEHTATATLRGHGSQTPYVTAEPRTEEDWRVVDDMVNSYLREAGVPPRPRGFVWYLELPEPLMPHNVRSAIGPSGHVEAITVRAAMQDAVGHLYS